jgi:Rhodopirellula transposase DDE domain
VARLLKAMGYSLQGNANTKEDTTHPDCDAQFAYLNAQVKAHLGAGQPVISVDIKKKNWWASPKTPAGNGSPPVSRCRWAVHDFLDRELGSHSLSSLRA